MAVIDDAQVDVVVVAVDAHHDLRRVPGVAQSVGDRFLGESEAGRVDRRPDPVEAAADRHRHPGAAEPAVAFETGQVADSLLWAEVRPVVA